MSTLLLFLFLLPASVSSRTPSCERWPEVFSYSQADAPKDVAKATHEVTRTVNQAAHGVTQVQVTWAGDVVHGKVGSHLVQAQITRLAAAPEGETTEEQSCFEFVFEVSDVDECAQPTGHEWAHHCHPTTRCVNTNGSYACACAAPSHAEPDIDPRFHCAGAADTSECCAASVVSHPGKSPAEQRAAQDACKAQFSCYVDECPSTCDVPTASCTPTFSAARSICTCPAGMVGSGRKCGPHEAQPPVLVDRDSGTRANASQVCGCQVPMVDHCSGHTCPGAHEQCQNTATGPVCKCIDGFDRDDEFGCVDVTIPTLKLNGPRDVFIEQCHAYEELGVQVVDDNAEEYGRVLTIGYEPPMDECLSQLSTYKVRYAIETKWTDPPFQVETRTVRVVNTNECKADRHVDAAACPDCVPKCAPEATCKDTIGSYACECPTCGQRGDGFVPITGARRPPTYVNGSGCQDSCPPEIALLGPNPKVFRVPKCDGGGLVPSASDSRRDWDADVQQLVRQHPELLCSDNPHIPGRADAPGSRARGGQCVAATDVTAAGTTVDVTSAVQLSRAERLPGATSRWRVAYDVTDAAGNRAETVYRTIEVVEYSLDELEAALALEQRAPTPKTCPDVTCTCPVCPKPAAVAPVAPAAPAAPVAPAALGQGRGRQGFTEAQVEQLIQAKESEFRETIGRMQSTARKTQGDAGSGAAALVPPLPFAEDLPFLFKLGLVLIAVCFVIRVLASSSNEARSATRPGTGKPTLDFPRVSTSFHSTSPDPRRSGSADTPSPFVQRNGMRHTPTLTPITATSNRAPSSSQSFSASSPGGSTPRLGSRFDSPDAVHLNRTPVSQRSASGPSPGSARSQTNSTLPSQSPRRSFGR